MPSRQPPGHRSNATGLSPHACIITSPTSAKCWQTSSFVTAGAHSVAS